MYDLLVDELIGVRTVKGVRRMTLPQLLAGLSAGEVEGYTGLRAHQADPWHVFLVQLAASVQARHPTDDLPTDPAYWREGLLELAEGKPSAWHLIWEDVTQPAFMQHPWKSWNEEAPNYKEDHEEKRTTTPDELDVIFASKNHDVKKTRIGNEIEAWLYALVTLQTISPYGGRGHFGTVRMNSKSGSRPIIAWASSLSPSRRFTEEVAILRKMRQQVLETYEFKSRAVVLTWLSHWDRLGHQYLIKDLEPWFIEAAHPLRMIDRGGRVLVLRSISQKRQIGSIENGDVGDPWIPIDVEKRGNSALNVKKPGFTPELVCRILFAKDIKTTLMQEPRTGEGNAWLVASVLASGGNCKTDGFYRLELPVPPKARLALFNKSTRNTLGDLAEKMLADASSVEGLLRKALLGIVKGGWEKSGFERMNFEHIKEKDLSHLLEKAKSEFTRFWEAFFFPTLWRGAEEVHETVRADWQQALVNVAQALLEETHERLPLPTSRIWRAITQGQSVFTGLLRRRKLPLPQTTRNFSHSVEEIA